MTISRREFLQTCAAASAGLTVLRACGDNALAPGEVATGGAFAVPAQDVGTVIDGERVFRLGLARGQVEWVAGFPTATYGVNAPYLGSTLRLHRGERVRIEVENQLDEASTLHWHGLEVPAAADGGPYQLVASGATWTTRFEVVQRAATAWYHPHRMHETARQAYLGLAGMIIIDDDDQYELPREYGVDDLPVVIQDRRLAADGTHPYSLGRTPSMHDHMTGLRGETMLVNGVREPRGEVPRGWVRLRLLNGANARNFNVGFSDNRTFQLIATDGGLLARAHATTRVLLAPGERAEILVNFTADAAGAAVELLSYSNEVAAALYTGMMGGNIADSLDRATFRLMTLVAGAATSSLVPTLVYKDLAPLPSGAGLATREMVFSMGGGTVALNGARMTSLEQVRPHSICASPLARRKFGACAIRLAWRTRCMCIIDSFAYSILTARRRRLTFSGTRIRC